MNRIKLLLIALAIYIIGASYFWACVIKGHCNNEPYTEQVSNYNSDIPALKINDGTALNIEGRDNLRFGKSEASAYISGSVNKNLTELSDYLKSNPAKKVYLTGLYKAGEQGAKRLGTNRAEDIKKRLVANGVKGANVVVGTKQNNSLYENENLVYGAVDFDFTKPSGFAAATATAAGALVSTPGTNITDGNFSVNLDECVMFDKNSATAKVNGKVNGGLQKVATYLKDNDNKNLQIVGRYNRSEKNTTKMPNLGLARAEAVKSELVKKGAKADQITTAYSLEQLPFKTGFVEYGFKTKQEIKAYEEKVITELQSRIQSIGSMNIYFQTGSDNISLTDSLANFIDDVKYYLLKQPNQNVKLIGHTDNVGNAANNKRLGLGRAKTIKDYFVNGGVNAKQIVTSSEGQARPIADNATKDGQAKNRRVEISIK